METRIAWLRNHGDRLLYPATKQRKPRGNTPQPNAIFGVLLLSRNRNFSECHHQLLTLDQLGKVCRRFGSGVPFRDHVRNHLVMTMELDGLLLVTSRGNVHTALQIKTLQVILQFLSWFKCCEAAHRLPLADMLLGYLPNTLCDAKIQQCFFKSCQKRKVSCTFSPVLYCFLCKNHGREGWGVPQINGHKNHSEGI